MKQRIVTDKENTQWTCIQVYAGMDGRVSDDTEEISKNDNGTVTVVCTPSGGAQSLRIQLASDWETRLSDEDLIEAIQAD